MKFTGMSRKVDDMGRVVLPIELRRNMNIAEGTELEISVDTGSIVLSPVARQLTESELINRIGKPVFVTSDAKNCEEWIIIAEVCGHHVVSTEGIAYDSTGLRFYDHEV